MEQFKIRASAAGLLMTDPKKKSDLIAKTVKTQIHDWLKESIYGIRKEIETKYTNKGLMYEDAAIDKAIEWLDLPFAIKNTERRTDDWFTGEPDLIVGDTVIDIKNSWDCWTFPLFENELPTDNYFYQVQVYMHLFGLKKASVVYVLLNTPETFNTPEISYDNVDKKYRIKRYDFEFQPEVIDELKKRVLIARDYINTLNF